MGWRDEETDTETTRGGNEVQETMVATMTRALLCLASVAAVSRLLHAKTPYTSVDAGRRNLRSLGALLDPKTVEVKSTPQGDPAVVGRGDSDDIMLLDNGQDEMIDNDFRDGDQMVIGQSGGLSLIHI